jgi:hypothetical protein
MTKLRIVYHPAECSAEHRTDSHCPYIHSEFWSVGNKYFASLLEADNYAEDQLTLKTGDDLSTDALSSP